VWPDLVVIPPPVFDDVPGMLQVHKPVLVQTLVPELPDEALGIGILNWLSRPDEVQLLASRIFEVICPCALYRA
jgi:hypothetical protein